MLPGNNVFSNELDVVLSTTYPNELATKALNAGIVELLKLVQLEHNITLLENES